MERYEFTPASIGDVDAVIGLIKGRIEWFQRRGIRQWQQETYLAEYPREYFEKCAARSGLYVMKDGDRVCGCMVISDHDPVWDTDPTAVYFHNLATDPAYPGIGRRIMTLSEQVAVRLGKKVARLDCQGDNMRLNRFYEELGYEFVETFHNCGYFGCKRRKLLAP